MPPSIFGWDCPSKSAPPSPSPTQVPDKWGAPPFCRESVARCFMIVEVAKCCNFYGFSPCMKGRIFKIFGRYAHVHDNLCFEYANFSIKMTMHGKNGLFRDIPWFSESILPEIEKHLEGWFILSNNLPHKRSMNVKIPTLSLKGPTNLSGLHDLHIYLDILSIFNSLSLLSKEAVVNLDLSWQHATFELLDTRAELLVGRGEGGDL